MIVTPSPPAGPLWRERPFRLMFAGAVAGKAGVQMSVVATPLVAVLSLDASPGQVGALATLAWLPFLLIGLPAGVWVDRVRRRGVMVLADLVRAVLVASVPAAWLLGLLTLGQLYAVVFLCGLATVFFDVANLSYLPHVAGRDRLVEANSALNAADSVLMVGGKGIAGYVAQAVTAPVALLVTAAGYLASGLLLAAVPRREPAPSPTAERRFWSSIREGLGFVLRHPILRPATIAGASTNLGMQLLLTMIPVVLVAEEGMPESGLGLFLAGGGVGSLLGAVAAKRLGERLGYGRGLWIVGLAIAPAAVAVPMIGPGPSFWIAMAGWIVLTFKIAVDNVILVSFRQRVTPDRLLGRQNASSRFLMTGALAVGAASSGLVGELAGPRAALWLGTVVLALVWVPVALSPIRRLRHLPEQAAADGPEPAAAAPGPPAAGGRRASS